MRGGAPLALVTSPFLNTMLLRPLHRGPDRPSTQEASTASIMNYTSKSTWATPQITDYGTITLLTAQSNAKCKDTGFTDDLSQGISTVDDRFCD